MEGVERWRNREGMMEGREKEREVEREREGEMTASYLPAPICTE